MLTQIGRGLSPSASVPFSKTFFLTTSLPREVTFTRASAATIINSAGKLVSMATNTPRFGHDRSGRKLGLLIEPASVNKNTNYNANPTATTGFTTSGTGTLSVVSDAAELANAGLELLCTSGMVFKAQATTASTFTVEFPGTTGNTNKHSASVYARGSGAATVATLGLSASPANIPTTTGYTRYKIENITPGSTSQKLILTVQGNCTVYFILNQVEEQSVATSVIVTTGATASRSADRAYIANVNKYSWFKATSGYIACRYHLPSMTTADSYVAVFNDGSTTVNTIGIRKDQTNHDARAYIRAANAGIFLTSNGDYHVAGATCAAGMTWDSSGGLLLSGGKTTTSAISALPTGITNLDIGARNGGASPITGYISQVEIGIQKLSLTALGAKLQTASDLIVVGGGQSLMGGYFNSAESGSIIGKQTFRSALGADMPEQAVAFIDGSTGGSAACKTTDSVLYWWDNATQAAGPCLSTFHSNITAAGVKPTLILWAQGEADSHQISLLTTRAQYKTALIAIFENIRAAYGDIPVFIQRIGRRTAFTNTGGVQAVREVQQEVIDAYSWCYDAAEIFDLPLFDQVHLTDAGFAIAATRNAQAILRTKGAISSGGRGPVMTGATRSGTTITVTLSHDTGTDFTPSSGIDGFKFFDSATAIGITTATRVNATTVQVTLASSPTSGNKTLYYGYDDMPSLNISNILKDNNNTDLPLRTSFITLS